MVSSLSPDISVNIRGGSGRYELRQRSPKLRDNRNKKREDIDLGVKQKIEEERKQWVASSEGVKLINDMYHPFM